MPRGSLVTLAFSIVILNRLMPKLMPYSYIKLAIVFYFIILGNTDCFSFTSGLFNYEVSSPDFTPSIDRRYSE
jgi:hypothetical protein